MVGNYGLIDLDTPKSAYTKKSLETGEELVLVFSDEFNVEGRTFYAGDDPYWEAVDFWYWGTVCSTLSFLSGPLFWLQGLHHVCSDVNPELRAI
jgi:beta-glucanase (GH16 family)